MKKLSVTLLFIAVISGSLFAQNIKKAYMAHKQENGTLYFITPQDVFCNKENGVFNLDMAKVSSSDTVRMNYTISIKDITPADSISFLYQSVASTYP